LKKRLLLIRHAQSQANREGRVQGWLDSPLSELGHRHAQMLSARIAVEFNVSQVFSSPLTRARQTAAYLGQLLALPLQFEHNLKEQNLGPLSGLTKQEVRNLFPDLEHAWTNNLPRPPITGLESDQTFAQRVQSAVDSILAHTSVGETIAVFSHGGTLKQMLKNWLNINHGGHLTFTFSNCSLTIVDVYPSYVRLVLLNDTNHLGEHHVHRDKPYTQSYNPR